jgi:phospholipid/cholesterol/gamma-HCH transport system substrate-binding protein
MEGSARRFRLGLFVLGCGGLFVALLVFILQNSFDQDRATYFILFDANVKGMVVGSRVNFQGVPIGVVSDLRFQDGKTLVVLRVDPSRANLQEVTRARLDRLLVTGQVTIELEGYAAASKSLPAGAFIQPKEDPLSSLTGSIPEVVARASDVLARLDRVLANVEQVLGPANQASLAAVLQHTEAAAHELATATVPAATAMLDQARQTLQDAQGVATSARAAIDALAHVESDLRRFAHEATALCTGVRAPLQQALGGMRTTLDDMRGLLRQLKLAPDSLLFGVSQPAAPPGGSR